MITLYSGTPGSGKSLHLASKLYHWIQDNRPVICINFEVNLDNIKGAARNKHVYFMDRHTVRNVGESRKILFWWSGMKLNGSSIQGTGGRKIGWTGSSSSRSIVIGVFRSSW